MILVSPEKLFQLESLDKKEKVGEGKDEGMGYILFHSLIYTFTEHYPRDHLRLF